VAFTRQQILERLLAVRERGEPIVMGGAGIGLVAKAADRAGIDVLMAYNTGPFRMDGHGSLAGYLAYGDANAITLELAARILPVVTDTPVVAGIGAADPHREIGAMVESVLDAGFSGVTNVPTAGIYDGQFRRHIEATGLGYAKEIDLVELCRERGIFTVAYAFTPEEASAMAEAGADVVGAHVGLTSGGAIGAAETLSLADACAETRAMAVAARRGRSDVLVVAHGGPFEDPESVAAVFESGEVDGYLGASSIERLPVERAIEATVRAFKGLPLPSRS
jgi:predicted TIM-barrel enzyme